MRAGQLDQRVTIQAVTRVSDGGGGVSVAWTDIGTVWAEVVAVRGGERLIADQQRGVVGYEVTMRNQGAGRDVTEAHRLVWRGETLNVRSAPNAGRAAMRTVEAESGVAT